MRVAHADAGELQGPSGRFDRLLDELVDGKGAGQGSWDKCRLAHVDGDGARIASPVEMQIDGDESALGLDGEALFFRFSGRMKIAGEDAETVARFFRLAAVRIED